jgi:lipopolysaccharide export system protein LptA
MLRGPALALGAAGTLFLAALALSSPQALAQSAVGGFGGLSSGDSKQPIDIESDQLEVDDKKHMAVFTGNVSATHGDNNLKAPRLEVFYDSKQQDASGKTARGSHQASPVKAASTGGATDPVTGGQIKIIHAMGGKVVVTSTKDQQEVTGDDAIYDVKAQQITMTGKEVTLSQGMSKVKGTKLIIDLNTGKANLVNAEPEGAGASTPSKPRIRAIFQQQTGADGKTINPLNPSDPKKTPPPAGAKKDNGTASQPAKKTAAPPKPNTTPASPDWQTQSH